MHKPNAISGKYLIILQNSMRAVVETHMKKDNIPPLKLKICKGVEDLTIKVGMAQV